MVRHEENAGLDEAFVASQREQLESMMDRYRGNQAGPENEDIQAGHPGDATADDADASANQPAIESLPGFDAAADTAGEQRIEAIERALEKIEEGTYGLSDDSGEPSRGAAWNPCRKRATRWKRKNGARRKYRDSANAGRHEMPVWTVGAVPAR